MKLRNPWGRDIWRGQWSPTSDKYQRAPEDLLNMLDMKRSGDKDFTHGEFVMAWADFIAVYDHVCLAIVCPKGWTEVAATGRWPAAPRHLWDFSECALHHMIKELSRAGSSSRTDRIAGRAVFSRGLRRRRAGAM